ncbi:MAG: hypothetical protein LBQ66_08530 [Planctomycetaceae bacterium]|nr:hypothetical protein [Planctomycetaceae bacterium]
MAFSSDFFGAMAHRGGRDARVPVRAASRLLSATPTFGVLVLPMRFPLPLSASDNDLPATQPPGGRLPTLPVVYLTGCLPYRLSTVPVDCLTGCLPYRLSTF